MVRDARSLDRRCLLVEDEWIVAMMLEETLDQLGYDVIGPVTSNSQALTVIEVASDSLDSAVLDVNLAGEKIYPVADVLAEHDIPFVFVTGYRAGDLPARFARVPLVRKPCLAPELEDSLAQAFAARQRAGIAVPLR